MSVTAADQSVETAATAEARAAARSEHGWVWQVSLLSIALGAMLALAIRTTAHIRSLGLPSNRFGVPVATLSRYKEQNEKLEKEVSELRAKVTEFKLSSKNGDQASELLRKQLQEYQAILGFAPVKGPGLRITLRHSPQQYLPGTDPNDYLTNALDVNGITSELWAAGAEAIAVSGAGSEPERFVVSTVVQQSGDRIRVNGRLLRAPYRIEVIGNPKELNAALQMPDGIVEARALKPLRMIQIEEIQRLVLPAYSRSRPAVDPQAADQ
jgi:uncharacterized protein YlxW (UPF0749 family)